VYLDSQWTSIDLDDDFNRKGLGILGVIVKNRLYDKIIKEYKIA